MSDTPRTTIAWSRTHPVIKDGKLVGFDGAPILDECRALERELTAAKAGAVLPIAASCSYCDWKMAALPSLDAAKAMVRKHIENDCKVHPLRASVAYAELIAGLLREAMDYALGDPRLECFDNETDRQCYNRCRDRLVKRVDAALAKNPEDGHPDNDEGLTKALGVMAAEGMISPEASPAQNTSEEK